MRALLSVYDKTGLIDFARGLSRLGWELISSGGTFTALDAAGIPCIPVEEVTGSPEMMDGRVKTIHPKIAGGILADRSKPMHMKDLLDNLIKPIGLVVCNLYPFTSNPSIEMIDVGGPTMVRAAAKNHASVGVVVNPAEYPAILAELEEKGVLSDETRRRLARDAFAHTAAYDAAIATWFDDGTLLPPSIHQTLLLSPPDLRYGENPHQAGAVYRLVGTTSWLDSVVNHSVGTQLGFLNVADADWAWRLVHDLGDYPAVAVVKHANPCGVSIAHHLAAAYHGAYGADEKSAYGGIVALNRKVDLGTAALMVEAAQADVIIAPGYDRGVVDRLIARRKNTRILEAGPPGSPLRDFRQIDGGFLVQAAPHFATTRDDWKVVTERQPTDAEWRDAEFAWRLQDHAKSNTIIVASNLTAWGIGVGQQNRHDSARLAGEKAGGRAAGGAASSDAFIPFVDSFEAIVLTGVSVVIQPGGAMHDDEIIAAANKADIAMVFTGERHFRH